MSSDKKRGLSKALKDLRRDHGWTLADVAGRTGIPASTLSKVENGKLSLSYDKLVRMSQGLGVDITRLFSETSIPLGPGTVSPSNRRNVDRAGSGHFVRTQNYDHRYLATELLSKRMDPIYAELHARTMDEFGEWVRHTGEEFAYVIEGEVLFCTEVYAPIHLQTGDSVYFDSNMGHAYLAAGQGPSRLLSVVAGDGGIPLEPLRAVNDRIVDTPAAPPAPRVQRRSTGKSG